MRKPVLIVDDCESDKELLRHAFSKTGVPSPVIELDGPEEAQKYLRGEGVYANREQYPLPCVVITDLKMPRADGFDLLKWMRGRRELEGVPKLVLSGSGDGEDRRKAAELGAWAYFVKPVGIGELVRLVARIDDTWIAPHCG